MTKQRDCFDVLTIIATFLAFEFSIFTYLHGTSIEKRLAYQACVGDLSNYPSILRESGQQTTDSIFQWVVNPNTPNRKEAKRDSSALLAKVQTLQGILTKYNCRSDIVTEAAANISTILEDVKKSAMENIDLAVDNYSNTWNAFVYTPVFSDKCCH